MWQLGAVANTIISLAYLTISALVLVGLRRTGQLTRNPLALATGVIFFSCGVGHGLHAEGLWVPGHDGMDGGMRAMWTAPMAVWDGVTACVALAYLGLRGRYGQLLNTPQMFGDEVERAAARRLQDVLVALPQGVVVYGPDGQVEHVNGTAAALLTELGGVAALTSGRLPSAVAASDPTLAGSALVEETRRTGQGFDEVELGFGDDGEAQRWLRASTRALREAPAGPHRVVLSFVDTTDRHAADAALEEAEHRQRATLEALVEGVVFYDDGLTIRAANPAAGDILGVDTAATGRPIGEHDVRLLDDDGLPLGRDRWPVVLAHRTGRPVVGQVVGVAYPDRPVRWLEINATPLGEPGLDGGWAVVASFAEITERLQRERALEEAEQRVRLTFEAAPIGMKVTSPDGVVLEANQALADLLGVRIGDLIGTATDASTHPDDLAEQAEGRRALMAGERTTFQMHKRYLHAAGHVVWAQLDLAALRDADGQVVCLIGQIQDISDRRRHEEELHRLAHQDALTGLLNRRGFHEELERHLAQVERYGSPGSLLMLDLDNFKYVNDTLGHKAGDELIVAVADVLRSRLRDTDLVARLGGDEFAVLLPRSPRAAAEAAALAITRALREDHDLAPGIGGLQVTASIGVAAVRDGWMSADELLVNADLAMYDAKEAGRDGVACYDTGPHAEPRVRARMSWMQRISDALAEDRFVLHAQPICSVADGSAAMHELLLRMRSDGGELVPPGAFLPIAERFDLVQGIDRWVLDRGCALLSAGSGQALSVNVSARSMNDPAALLAHLRAALARTGANPERLVVEITETAAIGQIHHARSFATGLRALGCKLAVDDFGAGFGSFHYLKHLPFDYLKVDGEFVAAARDSTADALIVRSLRDLAHGLGRPVIAEHCTDAETLAYLASEGIDLAQGFHLGRPRDAEQVLGVQPVS